MNKTLVALALACFLPYTIAVNESIQASKGKYYVNHYERLESFVHLSKLAKTSTCLGSVISGITAASCQHLTDSQLSQVQYSPLIPQLARLRHDQLPLPPRGKGPTPPLCVGALRPKSARRPLEHLQPHVHSRAADLLLPQTGTVAGDHSLTH